MGDNFNLIAIGAMYVADYLNCLVQEFMVYMGAGENILGIVKATRLRHIYGEQYTPQDEVFLTSS